MSEAPFLPNGASDESDAALIADIGRVLDRLGRRQRCSRDATHRAYLDTFARLIKMSPGDWGHEPARRTRAYRRAAFRYAAHAHLADRASHLTGVAVAFDVVDRQGLDAPLASFASETRELLQTIDLHLDAFEIEPEHSSVPPPSQSKRVGLGSLPADWRERFWSVVPSRAPYRDGIAVIDTIGARPVEVERGVRVRLARDGHTLMFLVRGAKVSATNGQPMRQIRSICARPAAEHLRDLCRRAQGRSVVVRAPGDARRIRDSVAHYGKVAFPQHRYRIAPYSFRHALSADLKAEKVGRTAIGATLGHASTRTASLYGWHRPPKHRGLAPSGIVGAKVPRALRTHSPMHGLTHSTRLAPKSPIRRR